MRLESCRGENDLLGAQGPAGEWSFSSTFRRRKVAKGSFFPVLSVVRHLRAESVGRGYLSALRNWSSVGSKWVGRDSITVATTIAPRAAAEITAKRK